MIGWVLGSLWATRIRMGLVALGVLWGTLGLASLLAFGQEMTRATTGTIGNFGEDLFRVMGGARTKPWQGRRAGTPVRLEASDAKAARRLPGIRGAVLELEYGQTAFRAGAARFSGGLSGASAEFGDLRSRYVREGGRFLSALDSLEKRRVAYLGAGVASALFGERDAVGEEIEALGTRFLVVGVAPEYVQISSYNGQDRDKVYVPDTTLRALTGVRYGSLIVGLENADEASEVRRALYASLGTRHGFARDDDAALRIIDYVALQERIGSILAGNRSLTAVVGVLGFLVAALGIANATWAHVEEQRREIALAMALGARRLHVVLPPLLEGALTALAGGLIGLGLAAAAFAAAATLDVPLEVRAYFGTPGVSLPLGLGIVLLLTVVGVLSGWFPARMAASVDPVEVLRDE
ncbi:Macrolide export ATP-binding/permease protein MacB [Planctomycetes bacterium Poly30]|uniref:Macrolide export ATP-binding/permease protein MacB n=1 Tax=Saltatorellus ferox TaxID=2528018 RepID=A0A518EKP1_9BACT|nr:Macrolide export ATP-binding/permease protein MacB [Planctomycetes bacterium Poly30]